MKFLVSLLGLGISGGGIFIGTLQQNLSNIKTEVDRLFEEIEQDIRDFSNRNPMTEKNACEIKQASSSNSDCSNRTKRNATDSGVEESKNTLGVWTDIWIKLLSGYINKLWVGDSKTTSDENLESRVFSKKDKEEALKAAEDNVKSEKQKFEKKLDNTKEEIENIYEKMKNFLKIMKLPKKYNNSSHSNTPYEEYVL